MLIGNSDKSHCRKKKKIVFVYTQQRNVWLPSSSLVHHYHPQDQHYYIADCHSSDCCTTAVPCGHLQKICIWMSSQEYEGKAFNMITIIITTQQKPFYQLCIPFHSKLKLMFFLCERLITNICLMSMLQVTSATTTTTTRVVQQIGTYVDILYCYLLQVGRK